MSDRNASVPLERMEYDGFLKGCFYLDVVSLKQLQQHCL